MMTFSPRIRVKSVKYWGGMCPFQIEGRTTDDRPFYLRSRHADLYVNLGEPGSIQAPYLEGTEVFHITHPDDTHEWGYVDLHDVVQLTGGFMRWPWRIRLWAQWEGSWFKWHVVGRYRSWRMRRYLRRWTKP